MPAAEILFVLSDGLNEERQKLLIIPPASVDREAEEIQIKSNDSPTRPLTRIYKGNLLRFPITYRGLARKPLILGSFIHQREVNIHWNVIIWRR